MSAKRLLILCVVTTVVLAGSVTVAAALPATPSSKFEPSQACGCHSALLDQWSTTMHAKALTDPIYLLKLAEGNKATNGAIGPFCQGCHGPIAVMSGEITNLKTATKQSQEGVTCDFCHKVNGTETPLGNTSATLDTESGKHAQFKDAVSPVHATKYSQFHETAEFCGTCHNVDHPGNGMHLEATYSEWKAGPYARDGIVCQDCHMTPGPGVTKPNPGVAAAGGPEREHIYTMTFVGGNVALGNAELAEERLKSAATLELEAPEIVAAGETAQATVTITNSGAGHMLPTGLTEVRQMWLDVVAVDEDGIESPVGRHDFGSILRDASGKSPVELWEAVSFESDDRIPPKQSVTDTFEFTMPDSGQVELKAALYYRSCSEEMAEKAGVEVPTTTMAEITKASYATQEIKKTATAVEPGRADDGAGNPALIWAIVGLLVAALVIVFFVVRARKAA
ncbi:MAG: multiheme c-type cytochrome [Coriobacteriia bacterium]